MQELLDEAMLSSHDLPDIDALQLQSTLVSREHTGCPGRPRIYINDSILQLAMSVRNGQTNLAMASGVHPRTVCRHALDHGLVQPGQPVYVEFTDKDGTISRIYQSSTAPVSTIPDGKLDSLVLYCLQAFPRFGRRMVAGHLSFLGENVQRDRIQASMRQVQGVPLNHFGVNHIERRVYSVAGPNSLWHHDGQHGW